MGNFLDQKWNAGWQPHPLTIGLNNLFHWLVGLVSLTDEEKRDAGIYPGYQRF